MDLFTVFNAIIHTKEKQVCVSPPRVSALAEDWDLPAVVQTIQATSIPGRSAVIVTLPNPISSRRAALFEPGELPEGILSIVSVSQGSQVQVRIANLRQDPYTLWPGLHLGCVESVFLPQQDQIVALDHGATAAVAILPEPPADLSTT